MACSESERERLWYKSFRQLSSMGRILFPVGATFSPSLGSYVSRFSALFDFGLRNGRERVLQSYSPLVKNKPKVFSEFTNYKHLVNYSWRRQWHPTPVLLSGKSHGRRSLVGCSPWGRWESGTTERLHFHFSLSCIGEGNGNPLQCSCLENPRDWVAWWDAVYGVAQSRTRLKRLSSSRAGDRGTG